MGKLATGHSTKPHQKIISQGFQFSQGGWRNDQAVPLHTGKSPTKDAVHGLPILMGESGSNTIYLTLLVGAAILAFIYLR